MTAPICSTFSHLRVCVCSHCWWAASNLYFLKFISTVRVTSMVWPLDTLNRNVLYFYLELPCSCVNSCQLNLNITQGRHFCAGRTPLCCFVVGFGSSCHTTLGINNWKGVILSLWSVRDVSISHHTEQNEDPYLTKRKSFRHLTALNITFFSSLISEKSIKGFEKDGRWNTRQRQRPLFLTTFIPSSCTFLNFFCCPCAFG